MSERKKQKNSNHYPPVNDHSSLAGISPMFNEKYIDETLRGPDFPARPTFVQPSNWDVPNIGIALHQTASHRHHQANPQVELRRTFSETTSRKNWCFFLEYTGGLLWK